MIVNATPLSGLLTIEPICFSDQRGFFLESYQEGRYHEAGICDEFIQDNHSRSVKNVLRGMHFQVKNPQAQLLTVMRGKIYDVCVDLRLQSATFGQWYGVELSDDGLRQIYMAPGFAHGFCVLSEAADLYYKVSKEYDKADESGLYWGDLDIGIEWPITHPVVTERDQKYASLKMLNPLGLPRI